MRNFDDQEAQRGEAGQEAGEGPELLDWQKEILVQRLKELRHIPKTGFPGMRRSSASNGSSPATNEASELQLVGAGLGVAAGAHGWSRSRRRSRSNGARSPARRIT